MANHRARTAAVFVSQRIRTATARATQRRRCECRRQVIPTTGDALHYHFTHLAERGVVLRSGVGEGLVAPAVSAGGTRAEARGGKRLTAHGRRSRATRATGLTQRR